MTEEYRTALLQQITGLRERLLCSPNDMETAVTLAMVLSAAVTALLLEAPPARPEDNYPAEA